MPKKQTEATAGIKLEPHAEFQKAIVGVNSKGQYVYDYDKLVKVCISLNGFTAEEAAEWVDYNIVGLEPNGLEVRHS